MRERGSFEVSPCPFGGVVSGGFIPSVPCRVIVISLQGPTSTDEVSLYLSITLPRAKAWSAGVTSCRESHIPQTSVLEGLLEKDDPLNGNLARRCIVLNDKVANYTMKLLISFGSSAFPGAL